jgi:hypothetical protein
VIARAARNLKIQHTGNISPTTLLKANSESEKLHSGLSEIDSEKSCHANETRDAVLLLKLHSRWIITRLRRKCSYSERAASATPLAFSHSLAAQPNSVRRKYGENYEQRDSGIGSGEGSQA